GTGRSELLSPASFFTLSAAQLRLGEWEEDPKNCRDPGALVLWIMTSERAMQSCATWRTHPQRYWINSAPRPASRYRRSSPTGSSKMTPAYPSSSDSESSLLPWRPCYRGVSRRVLGYGICRMTAFEEG
ncbi:unnamed protein product, partial [Pylaiella littoralis]